MFDLEVWRVRKRWEWEVYGPRGTPLLRGRETTRGEAKYRAYRALFFLLAREAMRSGMRP